MKRRSETAEMPDLVNDFRVCLLDVLGSQPPVPNAEIVHQVEQIRSLATALHESSGLGLRAHPATACENCSTGIPVSVSMRTLPRADNAIETFAITFSFGASTMLTKS